MTTPPPRRRRGVIVAIAGACSLAVVAAGIGLGALVAGGSAGDSAEASTARRFWVTGYAEGGMSTRKITASAKALTMVGVDGVNLTADGAGITPVSDETLATLATARSLHKHSELLIGNFDDTLGDFSPALAASMLTSPTSRASVVTALAAEVKAHHWGGVTVDLEALADGDDGATPAVRSGLTAFVRELDAALPTNATVSICLTATTGSYADLDYDLAGLSKYADHVVLMAYDQHGPTWSSAGPVGGLPWVKSSVAKVAKSVPKAKIQLGIGDYGYSWPGDGSDGQQYTDKASRALVAADSATGVWSAKQAEWHATLSDGTVIWWSDARSYAARVSLARSIGLGGVAVWSLGTSDALR